MPYQYTYGDLVSGTNMRGGEWKASQIRETHGQSLDSRQAMQSIFTRASYDITDAIQVFIQASYNNARVEGISSPQFLPANLTIRGDYGFAPPAVAARILALGLTTLQMGTMNLDMPPVLSDNSRNVTRFVAGASGKIEAAGTSWTWDAYYQNGLSRSETSVPGIYSRSRFALAVDAVRHPTTGLVVCRSTLTAPANGCVPWNVMGVGVNSQAAKDYILGTAWRHEHLGQEVAAVSVAGEPFSLSSGPVSVAFGAEHRKEHVSGVVDAGSARNDWYAGNYLPNFGRYTVTEGFVETVVPLAKDAVWARSLDINGAIRATSYSTSGYVTTWKIGATYAPVDDLRFRATRSRDIRAPGLGELFAAGTANTNIVLDPFNGNASTAYQGFNQGNPLLQPEKANTTGLGVVAQPAFFPGLSASFDFFNIDIKDAIGSVGAQQIVNFCFEGNQAFCEAITRGLVNGQPAITRIRISPFNTTKQIVRGFDLEGGYRVRLDDIASSWRGDVALRMLATRMLKDYSDNTINVPTDNVGAGTPKWKWTASVNYTLDALRASLSARGRSAGKLSNTAILCTSGCPTSTTQNPTTTFNDRAGNFYLDTSMSYRFMTREDSGADVEAFLNVRNIMNSDPNPTYPGPGSPFYPLLADCGADDCLGRVFRAGVRFKM